MRLKVNPKDAEVYVDGYYAGIVDDFDGIWQQLRLDDGGYHIEIRKPGMTTLTFDVRVQPGRTITYRGELTHDRALTTRDGKGRRDARHHSAGVCAGRCAYARMPREALAPRAPGGAGEPDVERQAQGDDEQARGRRPHRPAARERRDQVGPQRVGDDDGADERRTAPAATG